MISAIMITTLNGLCEMTDEEYSQLSRDVLKTIFKNIINVIEQQNRIIDKLQGDYDEISRKYLERLEESG